MGSKVTAISVIKKGNTTTTIEKRYKMKWNFGYATVDLSLKYVKERYYKETGISVQKITFDDNLTYTI